MELCDVHPDYDRKLVKKTRNLLIKGCNGHMVICEVLRMICDLIYEMEDKQVREKIIVRLTEAMIMAKKMSDRLHYYRTTYNLDPTGQRGKKFKYISGSSIRSLIRMKRSMYG